MEQGQLPTVATQHPVTNAVKERPPLQEERVSTAQQESGVTAQANAQVAEQVTNVQVMEQQDKFAAKAPMHLHQHRAAQIVRQQHSAIRQELVVARLVPLEGITEPAMG